MNENEVNLSIAAMRTMAHGFREEPVARFPAAAGSCDIAAVLLERLQDENKRLQKIHNDMYLSEGGWIWQGDGTDHLESLTCPVVIAAADLRDILANQP